MCFFIFQTRCWQFGMMLELQLPRVYLKTMTQYVALLRGIMPTNPNMKSSKLKKIFEFLGFKNVSTVIASGNVVFTSNTKNIALMEAKIEDALPKKLGFKSTTFIRTENELKKLVKKNPFKGVRDEKPNYLIVTFFKKGRTELCSVIDTENSKTSNFMALLEKEHGKEITTRTWKTVHRILDRMESAK